jgi:hypothetical protein
MHTELGGKPLPMTAGTVGSASYDYFTNTLVMLTGHILSGHTAPDGLRLRGVSSGYLNIAPDYALWAPRFYRRQ